MRQLQYSVAASLDGSIAGPNGEFDWMVVDPEIDFAAGKTTSVIEQDSAICHREAGGRFATHSYRRPCAMTNFIIYVVGTLLVVAGLAYGASRMGISEAWIVAGALVIIGLGLMGGIVKTRHKDPA